MRHCLHVPRVFAFLCVGLASLTTAGAVPKFQRIMIVIFENQNFNKTMKQPFFAKLASLGAQFDRFHAEAHPSEPNYIALTSGGTQGVDDNSDYNLESRNIVDLLEAKGHSWKVYVENWPGPCFKGSRKGLYARKHNPFISYTDISGDARRCAKIVDASQLQTDVEAGALPDYSFFVPNINDDAHDTDLAYADKWYSRTFGPLLANPRFTQGMLLVSTFDESKLFSSNHIYTTLYGEMIKAGSHVTVDANHYTLLRTIETNWDLGDLGGLDAKAGPLEGVWK